MACSLEILKDVPLFALLDEEELAVLAAQVDVRTFAPRQRIYKIGDPGGKAYVVISGAIEVSTIDEDGQEVIVDRPISGDFLGLASMLDQSTHQTDAVAVEQATCAEVDRVDIQTLIRQKPDAGMDLLAMLGRHLHAHQELVRIRSQRNPNIMIDEKATFPQRLADSVARFGGSWTFIISFAIVLVVYAGLNISLGHRAWDPYPFILLNLFLSMLAAIQAPVIMMSQNRQDEKDRLRAELDFDVNRRAESEIQGLARKIKLVDDKIADLSDLLRDSRESRPGA